MLRLTMFPSRTPLCSPQWLAARRLHEKDEGNLVVTDPVGGGILSAWTLYRQFTTAGPADDESTEAAECLVTFRFDVCSRTGEMRPCTFPDPPSEVLIDKLRNVITAACKRCSKVFGPMLRELTVWDGTGDLPVSIRQIHFAPAGDTLGRDTPFWVRLKAHAPLPSIADANELFIAEIGDASEGNATLIPSFDGVARGFQYSGQGAPPFLPNRIVGNVHIESYPPVSELIPI